MSVLKHFRDYLKYGYYPFFLEGIEDYFSKLNNVIEKVIFEDIAVVFNLKQTTLPILKKILWLVATSDGLTPNIDRISSNLGVSREVIYNCLEYLAQAGLLNNIFPMGSGLKMVRKPGKILLDNSNLIYAINGTLKRDGSIGGARETFFSNQIASHHLIQLHNKGDFFVDDKYTFEIGGRGKDTTQIQGLKNAYLVKDNIEIGYKNQIPLYLFGFLY